MRRHSWSFLSFLSSFVGYKFVQYHKIQSGIGIKKLHSALYIDNLHCANDPWLILEQTVRILNTLHYHSHKQNSYYPLKCNNWLLPRKENYTIWISSHFFFLYCKMWLYTIRALSESKEKDSTQIFLCLNFVPIKIR